MKSLKVIAPLMVLLLAMIATGGRNDGGVGPVIVNPPSHPPMVGQEYIEKLLARLAETPVWPPPSNSSDDPLLSDPHQTCNAVAYILKDQQHALSVAAANASTGIAGAADGQGKQLHQNLALWQNSMSDLSRGYRQLQGEVSGMVHSQQRTLHALKNMFETYDSHVELMKAIPSCQVSSVTGAWNRGLGQVQLVSASCTNHTSELLQSCNNATSRVRPFLTAHSRKTEQVMEKQRGLASDLEIVGDRMRAVIEIAVDQKISMLLAEDAAKQDREKAFGYDKLAKHALAASSIVSLGVCASVAGAVAGPLTPAAVAGCPAALAGAGTSAIAGLFTGKAAREAELMVERYAVLVAALHNIHAESLRADRVTAEVHSYVVA
jgi:hypothetical protein